MDHEDEGEKKGKIGKACKMIAQKKCGDAKDKDACMKKVIGACKKIVKNPCVEKIAKECKSSEAPKKCFWNKISSCKKEDEELNEIKSGDKKKVCAMKAKKWCADAKDQKKCFAGKMKWCMS
jgi:hypothetical protein